METGIYTPEKLKAFESWCVEEYHKGHIRSPVHLSGSKDNVQEKALIEIFKDIKSEDYIFSTYRSHYHALLKGVPEEWLKKWILENKSIHVMNKEHKIITSAIVGGTLSQAVGVAMAIKLKKGKEKVYAFLGDMTATLGVFQDCWKYAFLQDLPITFIIEDNGLSTDTPTIKAWGGEFNSKLLFPNIKYYKYERIYPHYGTGKRINFEEIKT